MLPRTRLKEKAASAFEDGGYAQIALKIVHEHASAPRREAG